MHPAALLPAGAGIKSAAVFHTRPGEVKQVTAGIVSTERSKRTVGRPLYDAKVWIAFSYPGEGQIEIIDIDTKVIESSLKTGLASDQIHPDIAVGQTCRPAPLIQGSVPAFLAERSGVIGVRSLHPEAFIKFPQPGKVVTQNGDVNDF